MTIKALKSLYGEEVPKRGNGSGVFFPDGFECGVMDVMALVAQLITGAEDHSEPLANASFKKAARAGQKKSSSTTPMTRP